MQVLRYKFVIFWTKQTESVPDLELDEALDDPVLRVDHLVPV